MEKKFSGVYTAIVTPFTKEGEVDFETLKKLIEFQIENKVAGIVPCGTTGESPTLSDEEQKKVIKFTIDQVNGRCQIIAGAGSYDTAHAVEMSKYSEEAGATGVLIVNPYYNKPTQKGLYLHFKEVADAIRIPVVVYNIKGRTGVNVETSTLVKLMNDCDNIIAVKEASGDIEQMKDVIANRKEGFSVLSGDDGITYDLISAGGDGVVSVASNIIPAEMVEMVGTALSGDLDKAKELDTRLQPFFDVEFIETNPIPIKTALAMKGVIEEEFRLPMCSLEKEENRDKLKKVLEELKVL